MKCSRPPKLENAVKNVHDFLIMLNGRTFPFFINAAVFLNLKQQPETAKLFKNKRKLLSS